MTLRPAFSLGQTVYLRIDPERVGMVTGINGRQFYGTRYKLKA